MLSRQEKNGESEDNPLMIANNMLSNKDDCG